MNKTNQSKALRAGFFVTISYGISQAIRLAGNLILTRLLAPEYFGIMSIAGVFIQGLHLLSDIGLEPAVIRSSRSHEKDFLNTAWTVQLIRGVILSLLALIIAYPVAIFYKEPILGKVIPVIGTISLALGLNSTSLITFNKELKQGVLSLIELSSQIISLVMMIVLAYYYRNIWALVAGAVSSNIVRLVWSHCIKTESRNRLHIEKEALRELLTFGKWIFIATAMMFAASQFDKVYLGKKFSFALLGVYSIATMFAEFPKQFFTTLNAKVLFPVINNYQDRSNIEIRDALHKPRRLILLLLALMIAVFTSFGDYLILFLYDERYHQASWMLPILAIGTWPHILHSTNSSCLYVVGKPQFSAYGQISKFIYMIIVIPISFHFFGVFGTIIAVALNDISIYSVINFGLYREKLSALKQDFFITALLLLLVAFFLFIRNGVGLGIPSFPFS